MVAQKNYIDKGDVSLGDLIKKVRSALMRISFILFFIVIAVVAVASIVVESDFQVDFFSSPAIVVLAFVVTVVTIVCCVTHKINLKSIPFFVCHLGIVVFAIGALLGVFFCRSAQFNIPIDKARFFSTVEMQNGEPVDFGFEINVSDFTVLKYDPDYALYKGDTYLRTIQRYPDGYYHVNETGSVHENQINGEETYVIDSNYTLKRLEPNDKKYIAYFNTMDPDEQIHKFVMEVNKPITYNGWKFYLMSYDMENQSYISLNAKNDPGVVIAVYGMWLLIIGTLLMCFRSFVRQYRGVK